MRIVLLLFGLVIIYTGAMVLALAQEPDNKSVTVSKDVGLSQNPKDTNPAEYLIRTGDTLDVIVGRRPELNWRGRVNTDGTISSLPFVNKAIHALCRTELQVADEIATAYAELIRNPTITVRVIERSTEPALLLGAVRTPQRFQVQRDVRLIELLFISGGVTDRASGEIQVFSPTTSSCPETAPANEQVTGASENPIRVIKILDLMAGVASANSIVRAGDIVTVMAAEPVYVTGGVVSPQAINFRDQMSLSRAIATVGGLTSNARGSEISIYRRTEVVTEQNVIKADYNAIKNRRQPDIPLKAYDIIVVPQSSGGTARRNWQSAAQDIIADGKQSKELPVRVLN